MQQSSDVAKQPGRSLDLYTLHKNNWVAITTQKVVVIISWFLLGQRECDSLTGAYTADLLYLSAYFSRCTRCGCSKTTGQEGHHVVFVHFFKADESEDFFLQVAKCR